MVPVMGWIYVKKITLKIKINLKFEYFIKYSENGCLDSRRYTVLCIYFMFFF